MNPLAAAALVALGAAVGAPTRFVVSTYAAARFERHPALGTLAVNVAGSAILGALVGAGAGHAWVLLVGTGFCGALTTFSTLTLEIAGLRAAGRGRESLALLAASIVLGVGAAWAAFAVGQSLIA